MNRVLCMTAISLLGAVATLTGCSTSQTLAGRVIPGRAGLVTVVPSNDERLDDPGLGGVRVRVLAGGGGTSSLGEGVSKPDGSFSFRIPAVGSGRVEVVATGDEVLTARERLHPVRRWQAAGHRRAQTLGAHEVKRSEDLPVRRTYRFRAAGLIYLTVTGFLAVAAISSQNNMLFWCLGLAIAGIAASGLISGVGLMGVRAERLPVADAAAGSPMAVRYRIRNVNRFAPAFGLTIYERSRAPKKRTPWPWRLRMSLPVAYVACVGPGQSVVAEAEPVAVRRGRVQFGEFVVVSAFPFGLANKALRFAQSREALVLPEASPVRVEVLRPPSSIGDRVGATPRRVGEIGEVFGVREYVPGDPLRSIAWRASAQHGDLVVRQHASPTPRRLWVRLEQSPLDSPEELERAVSLAAGLLRAGSDSGYAVGLLVRHPDGGEHAASGLAGSLATLATMDEPGAPAGSSVATVGRRDRIMTVCSVAARAPASAGIVLAADSPERWRVGTPATGGRVA
ncbi:MAG: DUF58 domain-containing protein [Phycisphaerales bacterium]|nr:DUF58 domain-containing protein [Phycisphaerales bacterium]